MKMYYILCCNEIAKIATITKIGNDVRRAIAGKKSLLDHGQWGKCVDDNFIYVLPLPSSPANDRLTA